MKKFMLILACLMLTTGIAMAQSSRKVMGVVASAETGQPIQGARVFVDGTTYGAITDAEGTFVIPNLPAKYKMLTVSFFGKQTENVAVSAKMNVLLKDNQQVLDEAVVIAYGTAKKSEFTGSVGTMKSDNLEKLQVSNVTNALAGNVAGVQAQKSNGQPGTSATILVRGVGSINATVTPLYVVDGVPFEGDISSIPSQDIESISIEKDAAASALYGARSGNGVVIITTKKGKQGNARVTFDMKLGQNSRQIKNYDVLQTPGVYTEKVYEALYNGYYYNNGQSAAQAHQNANNILMSGSAAEGGYGYKIYTVPDGQMLIGTNGKINPAATLGYNDGEHFITPDSWDKNTFRNSLRQEYNASISGGNNKLAYYASFNHLNDQGIIQNSDFKRYSFRTNVDYQINDWLKVGTNVGYTYTNSRYPDEQTTTNSSGNAFNIAYTMAPVYPFWIRDTEGNIMRNVQGKKVYDYGNRAYGVMDRAFQPGCNPAGQFVYDKEMYLMDIFSMNNYAQITPLKGLTITGRMGVNIDNTRYNFLGNPYYGQNAETGGYAQQSHSRTRGTDYQLLAEYRTTFNEVHHMGVLAGYDGYSWTDDELGGYGNNLYNPNSYVLYNVIDGKNHYGYHNEYSTQGYLFRGNYDFADKYFGSFSIRRDGSSRFHKDNRWGTFWSASAAWMMTQEEFMKPLNWLDELKVRGSFGQQGNDKLGTSTPYYYAYADQYTMTGANGVFSDGTLYFKGNKDLKWEKSNSWNFGFDFSVLKRKLYGSVEYYNRQTSNMLYFKTVPGTSGYTTIPMNIGKMRNNGVEFDLNSDLVKTKDVALTLNFNATFQGNKILKLHPDLNGEWIDGSRIYKEGKSMYSLYLTKWAGVAHEDATFTYQAKDDDGNLQDKTVSVQGGEALYWAKDDAGNEYKTNNYSTAYNTNRKATKSLLPKVYGGFGATITFFGFDASFQMAYSLGGKIYDSGYASFMHSGNTNYAGQNWHKDILKSWSPSNPNSNIPRVDAQDTYANSTSDRFLVSADYLNLSNVQIGYTLPKSLTNQLAVQKVRVYVAGDNLFLLSSRRGLDPRRSFVSSSTLTYSPIRTVSGGLTVTF